MATSAVIERAARRYCKVRKLDPDERVLIPQPEGRAVAVYGSRWQMVAEELKDTWLRLSLINQEIGEARARQEVKDYNAAMEGTTHD